MPTHQVMHQQAQTSVPMVHYNNVPSHPAPVLQTTYNRQVYYPMQVPVANQGGGYAVQKQNLQHTNQHFYSVAEMQNGTGNYFGPNKLNVYNNHTKIPYPNQYPNIHPQLNVPNVGINYQQSYKLSNYQQPNDCYRTQNQFQPQHQTHVNGAMNYPVPATSFNQQPATFQPINGTILDSVIICRISS